METEPTSKPPKSKRKRTASTTPRAARVKDEAILAIEKEAADKKAQYRKAQQSGGVLKRIFKLVERLTFEDKNKLSDVLAPVATLPLPMP